MNMLGLVFSTSCFQQTDQQQSSEKDALRIKFSDVPLENITLEVSPEIKSQDNVVHKRSNKKSFDDLDELSRHYFDVNQSSSIVSTSLNADEPIKKNSKEEEKKGKLNKMNSENDTALGNVDAPVSHSISKETALGTGLAEPVKHSEVGCNHSFKEDPASGYNDVTETCNTKSARNQGKHVEAVPDSATITSVACWGPMSVFLEEPTVLKTKSLNGNCNHGSTEICGGGGSDQVGYVMETSNVIQNEVAVDCSGCIHERSIEATCSRSLSTESMEHCSGNLLMEFGGKEVDNVNSGVDVKSRNQCSGVSNVSSIAPIQSAERDSRQSQILNKGSQRHSHMGNHKKSGKKNTQFFWQRTCKNSGTQTHCAKRSYHDHMSKYSASSDTVSFSNQNFFEGDGELSPSQSPFPSKDGIQQRMKNLTVDKQKMPKTHSRLLAEAPEWAVHESFHARHVQHGLRSSEYDTMGNKKTWEKSKHELNQPFKQRNANHRRKGIWVNRANLFRSGTRSNLFHREAPEHSRIAHIHRSSFVGQSNHYIYDHQPELSEAHGFECMPSFPNHSSSVQVHGLWTQKTGQENLLREIKPLDGIETFKTEAVKPEAFHVPLVHRYKSCACFGFEPRCKNTTKFFTPNVCSYKRIPVDKKDCSMLKTSRQVDAGKIRKQEVHQKTDNFVSGGAASTVDVTTDVQKNNSLSNGERENCKTEGKHGYYSAFDNILKSLPIYIGSELAMQALDTVYRLQIASQSIQLATGSPVAEFEKLLYSASPVVLPSIQQHCVNAFADEPIDSSLSTFQKRNVLLRDIWCWYEEPANYGMKVKVEDSQNSEGLGKNVSFHAHFVPFLSAIQLFGFSRRSLVMFSSENRSTDIPKNGEAAQCSLPSTDFSTPELDAKTIVSESLATKHMRSCNIDTSDGKGGTNLASSAFSADDSQVIFEYFEHDPPQQRKPLFAKVKELLELGASNPQTFGDPSNLECMNLQELHPASWYSVAWYPIYQIPEGRFRASFLTYHSLGYLVPRNIKSDSMKENASSVISPVLGMQSFNAQGECWFHSKKPAESLLKYDNPLDISELLKERIRTLEEAAAIFARGYVWKDQTAAPNRQPDYEFFLSRRR